MNIYKNVDELIQGIKFIISEDRCSLSDNEKTLLVDVIDYLQKSKSIETNSIDWNFIFKAIGVALKVLASVEHFKNLF